MSDIQISMFQKTDIPPTLKTGELAFSYKSGKLFIGPAGSYSSPPSPNVIELMSLDRYIIQQVLEGVKDHTSSSDAVYKALVELEKKIYITVVNNDVPVINRHVKTLVFDTKSSNFVLDLDPSDPNKMSVSIKPTFAGINIDNDSNKYIPPSNSDFNLKSGSGITVDKYNNTYVEINANIDDISTITTTNTLWSSSKIQTEILQLARLTGDNIFTGINTVPDNNIITANNNSKQIANTGSIKKYLGSIASQIIDSFSLIKSTFLNLLSIAFSSSVPLNGLVM